MKKIILTLLISNLFTINVYAKTNTWAAKHGKLKAGPIKKRTFTKDSITVQGISITTYTGMIEETACAINALVLANGTELTSESNVAIMLESKGCTLAKATCATYTEVETCSKK